MKMKFNRIFLALALGSVILSVSCRKETVSEIPVIKETSGNEVSFSIEEEDPVSVETRSILDGTSVETVRSGVTVGLYCEGELKEKVHATSFSGISFVLEPEKEYMLYALANMGDMRASLPQDESDLSSVEYIIPSYVGFDESISSLGIPMAGQLEYVSGVSTETAIPVKRLLAKVTAILSCDWNGARIVTAKVHNMNGRLLPFGVSAASGASDILDFQEVEFASGSGTNSLTATFYVPENMQGTINGIESSSDKAGDRNVTVGNNASKLTYLETEVESQGKYDGTIVYRSYLGNNATTNFDIERNYKYIWVIHYKSDTVDDFEDDWKHDYEDVEIIDYALLVSPNPETVAPGGEFVYETVLRRTVVKPEPSFTDEEVLDNTLVSWESDSPQYASVSPDGTVEGIAEGTAHITARYTPDGPDFSELTAYATVNVKSVVERELVIIPALSNASVGEPIHLKAFFYTTTDGVRNDGEDVTSLCEWSLRDESESISVNNTDPDKGTVTAIAGGSAVIKAVYSFDGEDYEGSATVNFGDVIEQRYRLVMVPPSGVIAFGGTMVFSVNRYTDTYINGVLSAEGNVAELMDASQFDWSTSESTVATVDAEGVATGRGEGRTQVIAQLKDTVDEYELYSDISASAELEVKSVVTERLELKADNEVVLFNETITSTATLFRTTNNVEDGGTVVIPEISTVSGGANITFEPGLSTKAYLTVPSKYNEADNMATVIATYEGIQSNEVYIEFENVRTVSNVRLVVKGDASVNVGGTTGDYKATLYKQTIINGAAVGDPSESDVSAKVTFESSDKTVATISGRRATGIKAGTTLIGARYEDDGDGALTSAREDSQELAVGDVITHRLVLSSEETSVLYNETISIVARYYTITNGQSNEGELIKPDEFFLEGGSNIQMTAGNPSTAVLKDRTLARDADNKASVTASYKETISENALDIEFRSVIESRYVALVVSGDSNVNVGGKTSDYTATLHTQTFVNGEPSGVVQTKDVSSEVTFTSSNTAAATMDGRKANGIKAGTTYISASYSGEFGSIQSENTDRAKLTVGDVEEDRYRIFFEETEVTINYGQKHSFIVKRYTDHYVNGVRTSEGTTAVSMSASDFTWTSSNEKVASVTAQGEAMGLAGGETKVRATLKNTVSDYDKYDVSYVEATLYVKDVVSHRLVLSADKSSVKYNETISLTAKYYTTTNGTEDGGVTVTPSLTKTGGSNITLAAGNPSTAKLTNPALSVVANNKATVTATYNGTTSNSVDIEFTNVETYSNVRLVVTGDDHVGVKSTTGEYSATLHTQKYVNGAASGDPATKDVSASAVFSSDDVSVATVSGRKATGVKAGTTWIEARYSDGNGSVSSTGNDRQKLEVNDVVSYRLSLSADKASVNYNESINLTATLFTITNGVENSGTKVIPVSFFMETGGSNITI